MLDLPQGEANNTLVYNGKTLQERLTGRFYTPDILARDLAGQVTRIYGKRNATASRVTAMDPFCGDGRLMIALIEAASKDAMLARAKWSIRLCDTDGDAARLACKRVTTTARTLNLKVEVEVHIGDSFRASVEPRFDIIITNPPWETLKPDSREIRFMSREAAEEYRDRLRAASQRLDESFPDAKGEGAWGGWATNLARCGWDLSVRSCRLGGVVGIVLPSTILADQASTRTRRSVFKKCQIVDVAAFPSEARLFERVDQAVVAMTLTITPPGKSRARIRIFDAKRVEQKAISMSMLDSEFARRDYSISVGFGAGSDELLSRLAGLSELRNFEGETPTSLWLGRELDETRISEKTVPGAGHPFIKGRMIGRHMVLEQPSLSVRRELCSGFQSAQQPRAVWRDVSRASQQRRMIGTIIPPGWIAGNSLHVACYRDGDFKRTAALHAILSSFVLEFQVRCRLATGHMSLGIVRQAKIPILTNKEIGLLAKKVAAAQSAQEGASDRLEVLVAKIYGLDRNDMIALVDNFPKIDEAEKDRLGSCKLWAHR